MYQTFEINFSNYTVCVSLNERTIYFKIIDTINFTMYESNTDSKELRVSSKLSDIYQIITKCFEEEDGYNVKILINSGVCKLLFSAIVGGFFEVNFEVLLREKLMSNDSQLTLNFNKLEQKLNAGIAKLNQEISTLENRIIQLQEDNSNLTNRLSGAHLYLGHSGYPLPQHFVSMGTTVLENIQLTNDQNSYKCDYIKDLYVLEKLSTNYFRYSNIKNSNLESTTLKELSIQCHGEGNLTSLEGIDRLPNLKILIVLQAPALQNIPTILSSYQHKIKSITIRSCGQVNVIELQTYCQKNKIALNIS